MENEQENLVFFKDADGNKLTFEKLDEIEYEGSTYVILVEEGDDLAMIFKACDDGSLDAVEDEAVLNAVFDIFQSTAGDEFNFID